MKLNISLSQVLTVVAVIITIAINILAVALPLNGLTTAELSDAIQIYFVPAGYVFSIWGVIYLGLIAFAYYQALPAGKGSSWLTPIYPWFWVSCAANIVWLFLWHYQQVEWSVLVMLILLVSLVVIYRKLEIGQAKVSSITSWFVHIPFSIYLGWISVATIANISGALWLNNWDGFGIEGPVWAAIMVVVAGILTLIMLLQRKDIAYAAVFIWAVVGIWQKFPEQQTMVTAIVVSIVAVLATMLYVGVLKPQAKS